MSSSMPFVDRMYDEIGPGSVRSAQTVVPLVMNLLAPTSVVDFGAGNGAWLAAFAANGVSDVQGIEGGSPRRDQLLVPADSMIWLNLEQPVDLDRTYDLAMSVEVAEHLSENKADQFVASIARHSDAVLFSAAIPLQGGIQHINEQWPTYWADLFAQHRFECFDVLRDRMWADDRIEWWYRQNLVIYARGDAAAKLIAAGQTPGLPRHLIHPELYELTHKQMEHMRTIRAQARGLVGGIRQRIRNR